MLKLQNIKYFALTQLNIMALELNQKHYLQYFSQNYLWITDTEAAYLLVSKQTEWFFSLCLILNKILWCFWSLPKEWG